MKRSTSTPIRWNFTGDKVRAQQLTGQARKLLGGVEASKGRRGGGFGHRAVTLAGGEKISITSLRGIANIEIYAPLQECFVEIHPCTEEELAVLVDEWLLEEGNTIEHTEVYRDVTIFGLTYLDGEETFYYAAGQARFPVYFSDGVSTPETDEDGLHHPEYDGLHTPKDVVPGEWYDCGEAIVWTTPILLEEEPIGTREERLAEHIAEHVELIRKHTRSHCFY